MNRCQIVIVYYVIRMYVIISSKSITSQQRYNMSYESEKLIFVFLVSATNINRDQGGTRSDYKGGSVVLNTIKSGVDFIIRKLVEYVSVGLTSILLLE